MERGATDEQVRMFAGENLLRVWENIEKVGKEIQAEGTKPNEAVWEERIKGWTIGPADSPFMFGSSRKKSKDIRKTAQNLVVNGDGVHISG
jgi:membrane dipeptidase